MALSQTELGLLRQIADLEKTPQGAYNIRKNGQADSRSSTANIAIESKTDKPGIDIYIKAGTKNESVHIPVLLSQTGLKELVYNDFHIGEGAELKYVILDKNVTVSAGAKLYGTKKSPVYIKRGETV
mgnify:CR=1 FL=1